MLGFGLRLGRMLRVRVRDTAVDGLGKVRDVITPLLVPSSSTAIIIKKTKTTTISKRKGN